LLQAFHYHKIFIKYSDGISAYIQTLMSYASRLSSIECITIKISRYTGNKLNNPSFVGRSQSSMLSTMNKFSIVLIIKIKIVANSRGQVMGLSLSTVANKYFIRIPQACPCISINMIGIMYLHDDTRIQ